MRKIYPLLAALPLLAACASTAPVREADVALPAAFEADAATSAAPLDRWWTAYGDPQLQDLVEQALRSAPQAEIAVARLEEARATRLANIRSAFPTGALSLGASARGSDQLSGTQSAFQTDGVSTSETANFDVSWEVDVWGKTREARRAVENDFAAKIFNIEGARAALAAQVADSLFAARGLYQQWQDAQESLRIASELQRVAGIRAQRGLAADADAARADAEVAQAQAAALALESELNAARRSLLVLLGRGAEPIDALPISTFDGAPPAPPATVPGDLLQRRPDVREAETRLALAINQLRVDRLNLFPSFTLTPGVGITRSEADSLTGFDTNGAPIFDSAATVVANWALGVNVNVPVLDRPRLLATARASGARAEQAVVAYEVAVQTAYGEAETALTQLQSDRDRVALLEAGERQAQVAYDGAKRRYDAGLDDLTSLLNAEQAWRGARSALTGARTQAMRRSVQTFKALGGGWTPGDDFSV